MQFFYLLLLLLTSLAVQAQPGTPDITFGDGGRVDVDLGFFSQTPTDLKVLPDSKMLVGGYQYNSGPVPKAFLTRLTAEGKIDSTFGVNGLATVFDQVSFQVQVREIELLPDGKFLVLYNASSQTPQAKGVIIRYNPDGSRDNSFGNNGQVVSPSTMRFFGAGLVISPDGNIMVGGDNFVSSQGNNFAILAFKPNGTPLTSFGNNGRVDFNMGTLNDNLTNITVQPDGKIVAAGRTLGDFVNYDPLILLRLHADGTADSTFATNGFFSDTYNSKADLPTDIHFLQNGDILLTGTARDSNGLGLDYAIYKFKNNGIPESSFGTNGLNSHDFGTKFEYVNSSLLQADGKMILCGKSSDKFVITRMDAQGEIDSSFGSNGKITNNTFGAFDDFASCKDIQPYPGNKLVAITTSLNIFTDQETWAVIRLNNDDATNTVNIAPVTRTKKIFPNPTSSGIFTLELTLDTPSELTISLFDAAGKNLQTLLHSARDAGTWQESLRIPQQFTQGIYFLKVQTGYNVEVMRVVKN